MEKKLLYKINSLNCSYDGTGNLIHANGIGIEEGNIYFILGKSGVGKSTIIEALGLMNNTIHEASDCSLNIQDEFHQLSKLWQYSEKVISIIRAKYFSFLFQTPNLINYYSAGENMLLPLLLSGADMELAKNIVSHFAMEFDLPDDIFENPVTQLSGGQKQRVAFIRALVGEYKLLIADEPTGNLDDETGDKLFDSLRDHIKTQNKTAIVVSHNTALANKYADYIITVNKIEGPNTLEMTDNFHSRQDFDLKKPRLAIV